jgi:hypothetical protein
MRVIVTLFAGLGVAGLAIEAPAQSEAAMTMRSLRISVFRARGAMLLYGTSLLRRFFWIAEFCFPNVASPGLPAARHGKAAPAPKGDRNGLLRNSLQEPENQPFFFSTTCLTW